MVFKRRDRRPLWKAAAHLVWPRGGWARAFHYVKHRMHRLPGSPERIGRGIWAGVFTTFTPFYGLHFVVAALLARIMQGNIFAALLATFFGNPLTYLPIGVVSLKTGHWLLGIRGHPDVERSLGGKFIDAGDDLWHNFTAIFTEETMDWHQLGIFYDEVFYPYMIGGLIPGIVAASVAYYLSVPVIRAYQNRRKGALKARLAKLKKGPLAKADKPGE